MKRTTGTIGAVLMAALLAVGTARTESVSSQVLDFRMRSLQGPEQDLAAYRGDVVMIVNVASRCGLTPQYRGLQALYERYQQRGFVVLGFPANDFRGQEPGSDAEIREFCKANYGVSFPMFSKIRVTGEEMHPLYARLTAQPGPIGGAVEWNFQKYLVDRSGKVVARFKPRVDPLDDELVAKLESLLAEPRPPTS
jgi:glutathione peroxidase